MTESSQDINKKQELSPDEELSIKLAKFIKQGLKKDGLKNLKNENSKEIVRELTVNRKKYDFSEVKEHLTNYFIDNNGVVAPEVLKVIKNLYNFIQYLQQVRTISIVSIVTVVILTGSLAYSGHNFVWLVIILAPIVAIIAYLRVMYKSFRMLKNIFK